MAVWNPQANQIFLDALEILSPESRVTFLIEACQGNADLRAEVESLLRANGQADSFLESPAPELDATLAQSISEQPGAVIGPYKLLEVIGEGGMGIVFMADQQAPVRRRVALKIIKPGMDTRQVIARFEAERQALALMDHSNIARVLDAGATASGRPYFVMELVRGVPITEYCDKNNVPVRERLELFMQVCHAVLHAHQKGIIHRDIKPTNVLVTLIDGRPVPKVIDFGVAKATNQQLTENTLFTNFAQLIGTPLYMSPEQAEMTSQDVDTRSDIYSLGVLLYELLTGTTPFDQKRVRDATLEEIRRIIREEDPPRPSARISTLGVQRSVTAARRKVDPHRLTQVMRGDLDWIVMKSIEKDRTRRYETASGLVSDILHYLNDEPVDACPPSAWYRLTKFARRNRTSLLVGALGVATLLMLVVGLAISNRMIAAERDQKARALAQNERSLALAEAHMLVADGHEALRYHHFTRGERDVDAFYQDVSTLLEKASAGFSTTLPAQKDRFLGSIGHRQRDLAVLMRQLGRPNYAEQSFQKAIDVFQKLRDQDPSHFDNWHFLANSHRELALVKLALDRPEEAEQELRSAVELFDQSMARFPNEADSEEREACAAAYLELARLCIKAGRPQEAAALDARSVAVNPSKDAGPTDRSRIQIRMGRMFHEAGNVEQALQCYSQAIAIDPTAIDALLGRSYCYLDKREFDRAVESFSAAIELKPSLADAWTGRAFAYFHHQQWEPAISDFSKAIELAPEVHANWYHRGLGYLATEQWDKAAANFTRVVAWEDDASGWYLRAVAYAQLDQPNEAIADLRQAIAKGFKNGEKMKDDPKLEGLRVRDDFKELLTNIRKVQE